MRNTTPIKTVFASSEIGNNLINNEITKAKPNKMIKVFTAFGMKN
jgi:hypothetical protein